MRDTIYRDDAIRVIEALECFGYIECKTKALVNDINAIPSADRPQNVIAQITFDEEKLREVVKEAVERFKEEYEITDRPQEWIPCSERLPRWDEHVNEMVLVCYGNGSVRFNTFMNGQWCQGNPLAWMPLPKPWKGADDE